MHDRTLLAATRKLLTGSDETLPEIARGAGVGYEWLKKFANGAIPNPGVNAVQSLHDYLAKRRAA